MIFPHAFRVWDIPRQRMLGVNSLSFKNGKVICVIAFEQPGDFISLIEGEFALMQSTGRKDKNGVPIFVDDIVRVTCQLVDRHEQRKGEDSKYPVQTGEYEQIGVVRAYWSGLKLYPCIYKTVNFDMSPYLIEWHEAISAHQLHLGRAKNKWAVEVVGTNYTTPHLLTISP